MAQERLFCTMRAHSLTLFSLLLVLGCVSAGIFGAGNSLGKKYPGARPIGYGEYHKILKQHFADRDATSVRPPQNWMFERRNTGAIISPSSDESGEQRHIYFPSQNQRLSPLPQRRPSLPQRALQFPNDREQVNRRPVFLHKKTKSSSEETLDASLEYEDFN